MRTHAASAVCAAVFHVCAAFAASFAAFAEPRPITWPIWADFGRARPIWANGPPSAGPPSAGPPSAGPPSAGPPSAGPPSAGPPKMGLHTTQSKNSKRAHWRVPPFNHTTNSTKRLSREEERMKIVAGVGKKKREIFGPPTLRGPTLRGPSLRDTSLRGTSVGPLPSPPDSPHCFWVVVCAVLLLPLLLFLLLRLGRRPSTPPLPPLQCLTFQNVNNNF